MKNKMTKFNPAQIELRYTTFNGKTVAYHSQTEFLVQVGRYSKGAYATKCRFVGNLEQAFTFYESLHVHSGWKKRLYVPSMNKPTLAKSSS